MGGGGVGGLLQFFDPAIFGVISSRYPPNGKKWNKQKLCETFLAKEKLFKLDLSPLRWAKWKNRVPEMFFFFFAIWSNNTAWKDGLCFSLCYRVLNKIQVGSFWVFFNSLFPLSLDNVIFFFETTSLTFCSMLLHLYTPFPITRSQFIDWEFLEDQWLCKTPKPLFLGIPTPFNIQMDWFNEIIHVATELS